MKLLLEKSVCRSKLVKDKSGLDCEYAQVMEVTPIPYGVNSTQEQQLCDQFKNLRISKKINWRINLRVKLKVLDELAEGKAQEDALTKSEASEQKGDYSATIQLTPYISSETGQDSISVMEMFRTHYPGSTFALDFKTDDLFDDDNGCIAQLLNAREMPVGASLCCEQQTVISAGTAKSLLIALSNDVFENSLVISVKMAVPVSAESVADTCFANKRILHEELASDTIIKAGNGAMLKCFKGFLMAQSDVLQAMFESGLEESKTGMVDMSDMSEKGVRAFLKYLYYWDVADAQEDIDIALELLYAADKYNVSSLEGAMVKLLTSKGDDAFTPERALKVFLFIRDKTYPEAEALRQKTIQILKMKFGELEESSAYKELLKKDAVAVNDLMKNAFGTTAIANLNCQYCHYNSGCKCGYCGRPKNH